VAGGGGTLRGAVRVPSTSKSARTPAFRTAEAIATRPLVPLPPPPPQRTKQQRSPRPRGNNDSARGRRTAGRETKEMVAWVRMVSLAWRRGSRCAHAGRRQAAERRSGLRRRRQAEEDEERSADDRPASAIGGAAPAASHAGDKP
jgi:hypothetical protein